LLPFSARRSAAKLLTKGEALRIAELTNNLSENPRL
jgi:hypothetical protein